VGRFQVRYRFAVVFILVRTDTMKFEKNGGSLVDFPLRHSEDVDMDGVGVGTRDGDHQGVPLVKNFVSVPRLDEYDVDFNDTKKFTVRRWEDILKIASDKLSASGT